VLAAHDSFFFKVFFIGYGHTGNRMLQSNYWINGPCEGN
jgi:hypothetical protein